MRLLLLCLALVISACASKDGWDGRVYHAGRASFRTGPVPGSWQREQGVEDISTVKECRLESNGEFSVIRHDGKANEGNKKSNPAVN